MKSDEDFRKLVSWYLFHTHTQKNNTKRGQKTTNKNTAQLLACQDIFTSPILTVYSQTVLKCKQRASLPSWEGLPDSLT